MSAMRIGILLCLLLAAVRFVFAHEEPPGPARLGTVTGRVIEHGPSGSVLKDVTVRLDNGTPLATTLTDSIGTFKFTAPGRLHAIYGVNVELPGWECDGHGHGLVTILPDSVTRLPDFIMWPVEYFDSATYREFMSVPSIEIHPHRGVSRPDDWDSTLLKVYRHYLHPTGPLVVRSGIGPPRDEPFTKKFPDVREFGNYLLIEKGRCRYMQIGLLYPIVTGMRAWDVDSIVPGQITKGGWYKGSEATLGWPALGVLKLYLHPYGAEFISSKGVWTPLTDGPGTQKSPEVSTVPRAGTHTERTAVWQDNNSPRAGEQSVAPQMIAGETDIPVVPFWKVDVKPRPINIPVPTYPDTVRSAGIEGQTVVEALVDIDGSVADARVLKPSGNASLDQAAVEAALRSKFSPAKQRDKAVRVWVSIPFRFSLN